MLTYKTLNISTRIKFNTEEKIKSENSFKKNQKVF